MKNPTLKQSNNSSSNIFGTLVGSINNTIVNVQARHNRLVQIINQHSDEDVIAQAYQYLKTQNQVLKFAHQLLAKLMRPIDASENTIELFSAYHAELDILRDIDFKVTKKCFRFIHAYRETPVISMYSNMAA